MSPRSYDEFVRERTQHLSAYRLGRVWWVAVYPPLYVGRLGMNETQARHRCQQAVARVRRREEDEQLKRSVYG